MSDKSVDFNKLIADMKKAGSDAASQRPTILGGRFNTNQLDAFLDVWRRRWEQMIWRVWEHISYIEFADEPQDPNYLQRAEIFGEAGHLSLRRDCNLWLWRYIGEPVSMPLEGFEKPEACQEFWTVYPNCVLRRYEENALLWGERKEGHDFWWEDRVAAANLRYPQQATGRVHLEFWRFTENGQTAFVWYRGLRQGVPATGGVS